MNMRDISPRLFAVHMDFREEFRPDPAHSLTCFLLADNVREKSFIREKAATLLRAGCRRFRLIGEQMKEWYFVLGELDEKRDPEIRPETALQLRTYTTYKSFADAIHAELQKGTDDVYLICDDDRQFSTLLFSLLFDGPSYPDLQDG